jgi:hypothetical protein
VKEVKAISEEPDNQLNQKRNVFDHFQICAEFSKFSQSILEDCRNFLMPAEALVQISAKKDKKKPRPLCHQNDSISSSFRSMLGDIHLKIENENILTRSKRRQSILEKKLHILQVTD